MNKALFNSRKFRQGSIATAITVVFLAVIILLNLVVSSLTNRFGLRADLTGQQVFSLSEDSLSLLGQLEEDIDIYVLNSEQSFSNNGTYFVQAAEVLRQYPLHSPRVSLTFVELMSNPGFTSLYPQYDLLQNDVLLVCGVQSRLLDQESLFNLLGDDLGNLYITSSKVEQEVTSAMLGLVSGEVTRVALAQGHNESTASGLTALLSLNNHQVESLTLLSQEIPPETDLVVISAPKTDYTERELQKLDQFLYNNGNYGKTLFYMAAIDQPEMPALSAFLAEWGIGVGDGSVFQTDYTRLGGSVGNQSWFLTIADFVESDYAEWVIHAGIPVYMPNARPLEDLSTPGSGVSVLPLLVYSEYAGIRASDSAVSGWAPSYNEICGPIPALLLAEKSSSSGESSYLLAASTSLAVEESILAEPVYANSSYFLALLSALTGRGDTVMIESKQIGSTYLGIDSAQALFWGTVFLVVLPLAVLAVGTGVYLSRRHR